MTNHIVSLFDIDYLTRALALYESARRNIPDCDFYFLCLDERSRMLLEILRLEHLSIHTVDDLQNVALEQTRRSRTRAEFAFTAKSNYLAYLVKMGEVSNNDILIWADADMFFYSPAKNFLREIMDRHSIVITPHKFSPGKESLEKKVGKYNAGMIFFKVNKDSRKCIDEWSRQCIDWCFNRHEDGKLGDQTYLDSWHDKYGGVYELPDKGVNAGTWNIRRYKVSTNPRGEYTVDGEPLITYHFHGLKLAPDKRLKIKPYPICVYHNGIYEVYVRELREQYDNIQQINPGFEAGIACPLGGARTLKQIIQKNIRNRFSSP